MSNCINRLFENFKDKGERYATIFFLMGFFILILLIIFNISDAVYYIISNSHILSSSDISFLNAFLVSTALALITLAFASISIGMAAKSDKIYTELLKRIDANIKSLPCIGADKVTPSTQQLILLDETVDYSKKAAQKRLDEDTNKVGHRRGELYQVKKGKWAINWGGKYRL